jgi:hypothetical protein
MRLIKITCAFFALALMVSCSKEYAPGTQVTGGKSLTQEQQDAAAQRIKTISTVKVYNHTMNKFIVLKPGMEKSFSFADPDPDWNFGTSANMEIVETQNGSEVVFVSAGGGFGDGAGGFVSAGPTSMPIDYAFCFSVDGETAFGINPGGDVPVDGISGVLGFAGDLEGLANGDFDVDDDPFDFFRGWAYYWVYEDEAQGSYNVLDWHNWDGDVGALNDEAFSFVFDFQEGHVFWSTGGNLNVSGGNMNFNGEYFAWLDFLDLWFSYEPYNGSFQEVSGSGVMGCD